MGRKASNKIKVQLQVPELTYQRIAVKAMASNMTTADYLQSYIEGIFGVAMLPLLTPETPPAKTEPTEETKSAPPKKR